MSDSNRTRTSLIAEVTPGVTPGAPTMLVIPKTSCSLKDDVRYVESGIIRDDANVQSVLDVSAAVSGGLGSELQFAATGDGLLALMLGAMRATETAAATEVTGVTASTPNLSATGIHTGVEVGDIVRVRTSADVLLGYFVVASVGTDTISIVDPSTALTGSNLKVQRGARAKNGVATPHFSIEHARLDSNLFHLFRGVGVGGMTMSIADEQITRLEFALGGMNSQRANSAFGSVYTSPANRESITSVRVPTFDIDQQSYEMMAMTLQIDNGLVPRRQVGTRGPTSLRRGSFRVTGSVDLYLNSWGELDKFSSGMASDLLIVQQDSAGNAWGFSIPKLKWTDATEETAGRDQDDMARLQFQAELQPTQLMSMRMQRWSA
jgi:hypothetical protein